MSLGKQLLGEERRKALRKIERRIQMSRQLKELVYGLGFFFSFVVAVVIMSHLPPAVNYGIAALVTLALVLGLGWLGFTSIGFLRRSGNPAELLPFIQGVMFLTIYFFALGLVFSAFTGWMSIEEWVDRAETPFLWMVSLCLAAVLVLVFYGLVIRRHYLNCLLPIPLRGALVRVEDLLDGYSERPVETDVGLEDFFSNKGKGFLKELMFLGIIPDYQYREDGKNSEAKLFIGSPSPPMKMPSFLPFSPSVETSHVRVSADGTLEVYLSSRHYRLLRDPYSYHQLCGELAGMLEEAYQRFAKGEERKAFDVFVVKGKGVLG